MRRIIGWIGAVIAVLLFFTAAPAQANVNNFSYESWDVEYELALDEQGRAVAKVTERLVPIFPDFDQNRGIVRALPLIYEKASARPENISVTDGSGAPVPFEVQDDDTFRAILVGDDSFVHGRQEYVISYTLHDVMLAATETQVDEFYWDILPLERSQPITEFSAVIGLSDELTSALTGDSACYQGGAGSTSRCDLVASSDGAEFTLAPMPVNRGHGITVAIGFAPGTARQPPERLDSFLLDVVPSIFGGVSVLLGGLGVVALTRLKRRRKSFRGTVIAQYDVPPYLPPLLAAPLTGANGSAPTAEFIHLAVSGAMRIEESQPEKSGLKRSAGNKRFRLLDPSKAQDPLDKGMLQALFSGREPGSTFTLPKASQSFSSTMSSQTAAGMRAAKDRGYFTRETSRLGRLFGLLSFGVAAITALLLFMGSSREFGTGRAIAIVLLIMAAVAAIASISSHRVHTPLGAESTEYLEGVREFIRVAEADRLKMLQSYSGADRLPDGSVNVVHVYEQLLPYAILFGLEKEWGKALQVRYQEQGITAPLWYPGIMHGNRDFSSELRSFTSSVSSAASYTSSSSGGSSGGGSSGGGGGGGFSGGR